MVLFPELPIIEMDVALGGGETEVEVVEALRVFYLCLELAVFLCGACGGYGKRGDCWAIGTVEPQGDGGFACGGG